MNMNYTSFIVKVIKKPIQTFFDDKIPMTQFVVQIPQLRNNDESTIMRVTIWGKLGYDIIKYYQVNDYMIIEGYISIRKNLFNSLTIGTSKKVEMSIYKVYPFIL
uniref:Single-stranded DNA binding protein n=1 Tax=Plagiogramma staurophorum TaxID=1003089 RepID=A0A2U9NMI2_9STRA|nr:hypothetical protein ycf41 [Plagiogramma staurophorum]YP_009495927.1 hypothetical protein ycf41 [Plagiogramma staurophorum]AWT38291.1 hypothetical protein ycf41 [Plagiogramma staurophorum]AWT38366.1 hypothetical protein ycf41 [Plagiogramma staurophorum]